MSDYLFNIRLTVLRQLLNHIARSFTKNADFHVTKVKNNSSSKFKILDCPCFFVVVVFYSLYVESKHFTECSF